MPSDPAVHVWKVPLVQPPEVVGLCRRLLSPEELQRAAGFHLELHRERWIVGRGALRLVLARQLGGKVSPAALLFTLGPHGKPQLQASGGGEGAAPRPGARDDSRPAGLGGLQFNLSHCEDLAVVAVTGPRPVGVDVERIRPLSELRSIRERYFSDAEQAFVQAAAAGGPQLRAFLTLWTRREAAAKALGLDLQAALARVRPPVYPAGGSAFVERLGGGRAAGATGASAPGASPWWLADLPLDADHVGAVCVHGGPGGSGGPGAEGPAVVLHELLRADFF